MNYHHSYHAGNFADVLKHVLLIELLSCLTKKPAAFCYLDTHAGFGYHDLQSTYAIKTKEYLSGIEKIFHYQNPPAFIKSYLDCIQQINDDLSSTQNASLRFYPGSTTIAKQFARANDRLIACELQPETYQTLKSHFHHDKRIAVHHLDGYLALKAFTPPQEKRGLILIDPPFENPDEFKHIHLAVNLVLKRWQQAIIMIWYPLKETRQVDYFLRSMKQNISQPILITELSIYPDLAQHLNGCGIAIVNPPWQFDQIVNTMLPWLWKTLSVEQQGRYRSYLLK